MSASVAMQSARAKANRALLFLSIAGSIAVERTEVNAIASCPLSRPRFRFARLERPLPLTGARLVGLNFPRPRKGERARRGGGTTYDGRALVRRFVSSSRPK